MKDWLIAHRGARCDGRENTLAAFKAVKNYPLGWVELDLHSTKDNIVVIHHNFDINGLIIKQTAFKDLKKQDPELLTFKEAIIAINASVPVIVEIKETHGNGHTQIAKILHNNPSWRVASYDLKELLKQADAGIDKNRMFLYSHKCHPLKLLNTAQKHDFGGIGLSSYLLNPTAIWLTHHKKMQIYTYTVNSLIIAWILRRLFPYLGICTDRPDRLQKLK